MLNEKLFAKIHIGESVIVANKEGELVDDGFITKIESRWTSTFIVTIDNERTYEICGWRNHFFLFNKEKTSLALMQKKATEKLSILHRNTILIDKHLSIEEISMLNQKIEELSSIVNKLVSSNIQDENIKEKDVISYQHFCGNSALTDAEIEQQFYERKIPLGLTYLEKIRKTIQLDPPENLVSIQTGKKIDQKNGTHD